MLRKICAEGILKTFWHIYIYESNFLLPLCPFTKNMCGYFYLFLHQ